jgi:hypothetical protein
MLLALWLVLQAARLPTVGDTIWVSRTVDIPAGHAVRAPIWEPSGAVEALGRPIVVAQGSRATIRYPLVAWEPGVHRVLMPGPLVLAANGGVDSLPAESLRVEVASVLPAGTADSTLPIQPAAGLVPRGRFSFLPLVVFLATALLLLTPLWWLWNRRGQPALPEEPAAVPRPRLEEWAEAGEGRAVAAVTAAELRGAIARRVPGARQTQDLEALLAAVKSSRPHWPLNELAEVLRRLENVRFADRRDDEGPPIHRRAADLMRVISMERT